MLENLPHPSQFPNLTVSLCFGQLYKIDGWAMLWRKQNCYCDAKYFSYLHLNALSWTGTYLIHVGRTDLDISIAGSISNDFSRAPRLIDT